MIYYVLYRINFVGLVLDKGLEYFSMLEIQTC